MSCLVKLKDPAVQFDIQPAHTGGNLGDVGVLYFVPPRLIAATVSHVWALIAKQGGQLDIVCVCRNPPRLIVGEQLDPRAVR